MSDELDNLEGFSQFMKPVEVAGNASSPAADDSPITADTYEMYKAMLDAIREACDILSIDKNIAKDAIAAFDNLSESSKKKCICNPMAAAELAEDAIYDGDVSKINDAAFDNVPTPTDDDMADAADRYFKPLAGDDTDSLMDDLSEMLGCVPAIEKDIAKKSGSSGEKGGAANDQYTVPNSNGLDEQMIQASMDMLHDKFSSIAPMSTSSAAYSQSGDEIDDSDVIEKDVSSSIEFPDITKRPDEKYKSIQAVPFTMREFADRFKFNLDDLENMNTSYDASKFAGFIPEGFERFDRITPVQCFYYAPDEDILYVLMACHYGEDKCDWDSDVAFPAAYAIYKDADGQYRTYVPKAYNAVDDSGKPITTDSIGLKNDMFDDDDESSLTKPEAYIMLFANSGYDERKIKSELSDIIYKKAWSVTTLKDIGELTTSPICKQYDDGYVFVGTVSLNKSDETKEFFTDMEMRIPADRKIEFYVRMSKEHLSSNNLRRAKDIIEKKMDLGPDSYIMTRDLKARGSILYVDCMFD